MSKGITRFRKLLAEVHDLRTVSRLLEWDQEVMMPPGGAEDRASQLATISALAHDKFISDQMGEALDLARAEAADLDPDSDSARLVSEVGRDIEKQRKVSADWVTRFSRAKSRAQKVWQAARADSDFQAFVPNLKQVFELRREYAQFFAPYDHIYDPLLDDYEPGMTTAEVEEIFQGLRTRQVELVHAIAAAGPADDSLLRQQFEIEKQWQFGEEVIRDFGYDFERGRQDKSTHPFTTHFGIDDVRITTRFDDKFLPSSLFATLHEAGHALYEQGVNADLGRTPLAEGTSLGVHESQSRLWENLVGRSLPFWRHYYPRLQELFPAQLGRTELDSFYRAVNTVEPSHIRVDADEATYNLHVMLRFELEKALLLEELPVEELASAWNEKSEEYLGITPPTDALGVLQDIHWAFGLVGYFPTYTLGNLIACQWWQQIQLDLPEVENQIAEGDFAGLLSWLRANIHQHGRKFKPTELIKRITGGGLSAEPYLQYLAGKFGSLYGLSL